MLYTILINQKSVVDNGFNLKANHIAVLETVVHFISSCNMINFDDKNGRWYWISNNLIIDELPMFEIGVSRCRQLIKDLCECKMLESHPDNQKLGRNYLRIGSNYDRYKRPYQKIEPIVKKLATPLSKNWQAPYQNFDKELYNKDNNSTKNNNKEKYKKEN